MTVVGPGALEPMVGDPDDHRPESRWRLITDPGDAHGRVDIPVIFEEIAPGDAIPLHRHPIDEVVIFQEGAIEGRIGADTLEITAGMTAFVPHGVAHGWKNVGHEVAKVIAIFPQSRVGIEMLERNPAPGTEGRAPSTLEYDLRTGEFRELG